MNRIYPSRLKMAMSDEMATLFEPPLEILVGARGMSRFGAVSRMAVEMREELVAEPFELDQEIVHRRHVGHDSHAGTPLVRKFGALVEDVDTIDLRAGNKEKLLIGIGGQLLEAIVKK